MNSPAGGTHPVPKSILQIEGDPTKWGLADLEPVSPNWGSTPVELALVGPLAGTMILAPWRPGNLSLLPSPPGDGWVPAQKMVQPYLYVPSAAGLPSTSPVYWLAALDSRGLAGLLADIKAAMVAQDPAKQKLIVQVKGIGRNGVVVLNGAQLAFAVVGDAEGGALAGGALAGEE
jgi:hypothetical protein